MNNDITQFFVLKFFSVSTGSGKASYPILVI